MLEELERALLVDLREFFFVGNVLAELDHPASSCVEVGALCEVRDVVFEEVQRVVAVREMGEVLVYRAFRTGVSVHYEVRMDLAKDFIYFSLLGLVLSEAICPLGP